MGHLSPDVLLDIAEDARRGSLAPHLATCASCRQQVEEVRRTLALVSTVDVPEPSPLFWDHLSTRVREAVAVEAAPPLARGWLSWQWTAAVSSAAVLVAVGLILRSSPTPAVSGSVTGGGDIVASGLVEELGSPDDPSLNLIADLAGDLDWDGAAEAGFVVRTGAAEGAVTDLSIDERVELRRLLTAALARGGRIL